MRSRCIRWSLAAPTAVLFLILAAPALADPGPGEASFAARVRDAVVRAELRLTATELDTPPGRYAYYTTGPYGQAWKYTGPTGWAAGYVPAGMWSCYQLTGQDWWRRRAAERQAAISRQTLSPESLNVGALFYPSLVRGYKLTGDDRLRTRALTAAGHMAGRYDPVVGAMLSRPGTDFNVIVDSLMKSQFLWWAARSGGDPGWAEIARRHALTIARDFVRADGSTYQVVYYDRATGAVTRRGPGSAYSEESTWARGQAWAMLGFANAYRETRLPGFLGVARDVCDWYLANLPEDAVPYWDFAAPDVPLAPRDSSAAAIAAVALLDLAQTEQDRDNAQRYEAAARRMLATLMTADYSSPAWGPAVLAHGTYSWRLNVADRGLAYGDAYFLEALLRLRRFEPAAPRLALAEARASSGDAGAAVDGDAGTAWTAAGRQTLDLRLATGQREVGAVRVALLKGDSCAALLDVLVSTDGVRWQPVARATTSGETVAPETFDFAPVPARWVRLVVAGTTHGMAAEIAEVQVYPAL